MIIEYQIIHEGIISYNILGLTILILLKLSHDVVCFIIYSALFPFFGSLIHALKDKFEP
jgi:hypothetical protein